MQIDPDRLILIVVGAHLTAEAEDRPLAYRLRERLMEWLAANAEGDHPVVEHAARVLVCTDLWYLNNDALRTRPTISVGSPSVNALSAFLGDKLPSAFAIEDVLLVQFDLDLEDLIACCWGVNQSATLAAVDAFAERYLEDFMREATRDWEA